MYNENWIYSFCVSLTSKTWAWQELNDTDVFMSEKKFFSLNLKKGTKYKPNGERFFCEIRASWIVNWSFKRFSTLIIHFKQMNDDKAPTIQHFPFFFKTGIFVFCCIIENIYCNLLFSDGVWDWPKWFCLVRFSTLKMNKVSKTVFSLQ